MMKKEFRTGKRMLAGGIWRAGIFFGTILLAICSTCIVADAGKNTVTPDKDVTAAAITAADYNQREDSWSQDKLGKSKTDMYHSGCMICCIAATLAEQGGEDMTPGEWNSFCGKKGIYTSGGAVMWDQLEKNCAGVSVSTDTKDNGRTLTKLLEDGICPIVKVKRASGAYHWILLIGAKNGEFQCMDPIEGNVDLSFYQDRIYAVRVVTYSAPEKK